ncbi:hypothetical protein SAMN05192559_103143 [Halobacillus karajensis]|uniref:Uncharacterized protein n=1 Tax=Halobacillus karajensis TaxID=195088 RepID=A0A024P436_9BACI|nr:hypothetical protein [Halobacillus karajensis]CDQ19912.1 hypothetical protein BN982_02219 [Halobacillus karajensis]CDQ22372.1 hypothetical protein BN983_00580 [Halobacillus karajensis]CDQ28215.1 hypothetical protein BN981_02509 [Halobacillus karajensis]SEH70042.1 hypothetical protein SAMN05192559_103143 [Halobacillus karajensis]
MDDRELQIFMKKYLRQWMMRQLSDVKEGKKGQSFVYLDEQTLQMLLMMLLMNKEEKGGASTSNEGKKQAFENLLEEQEDHLKEILDLLNN